MARVRAGFREPGTKAMKSLHARGLESPDRLPAPFSKNRLVSPSPSPDFGGTSVASDDFHFRRTFMDSDFYGGVLRWEVMSKKQVVRIEDRTDRWRFTCPRYHRSWEPTNHHFWCERCSKIEGVDAVFYELRDRKTGELRAREEVRLMDGTGPFDLDLDVEEGSA